MIKAILFVLFFILLAVSIALAIVFGVKAGQATGRISDYADDYYHTGNPDTKKTLERKAEEQAKTRKKYKIGVLVGALAAVVMLGCVITIPGSFHQVDTGTVAVVRHLGKIEGIRNPGTYFDFYMTNSYETYDTKVQQDKITTAAYSKDGQTMELEVFLQYQVQAEHIMDIATQYGTLDALQARIETQTIEKTKVVMSSAEAMTIIQNRSQFSNDVSTSVREGISNDYYVNVKDVVLTNIDFTDEFEKAVEDKVIAEQEKQAAITRAQAELEVAKLEAQKKIEEARGNAEAQKILAQASAEAATYNIIELARTLGYTVHETYLYSVTTRDESGAVISTLETSYTVKQAETEDVVYLGTKYDIDINSGPGADKFKELVEDYLKYLAYLEQWNGELPDVIAGDDALSIIVPNN